MFNQLRDWYLYIKNGRIIRIEPYREAIKPIIMNSYYVTVVIASVTEEMYFEPWQYKYDITQPNNFVYIGMPEEKQLNNILNILNKMKILEKFRLLSNHFKSYYIKTSNGDEVYNFLVQEEIKHYKENNVSGTMLKNLLELSELNDIDTLVNSIEMKYEDMKQIFTYLLKVEIELRNLLQEDKLQDADNYIENELLKIKGYGKDYTEEDIKEDIKDDHL